MESIITESIELNAGVCPGVLRIMMDFQCHFNLPIEIEVGAHTEDVVNIKLKTIIDEGLLPWFLNSSSVIYQLKEGFQFDVAEEMS